MDQQGQEHRPLPRQLPPCLTEPAVIPLERGAAFHRQNAVLVDGVLVIIVELQEMPAHGRTAARAPRAGPLRAAAAGIPAAAWQAGRRTRETVPGPRHRRPTPSAGPAARSSARPVDRSARRTCRRVRRDGGRRSSSAASARPAGRAATVRGPTRCALDAMPEQVRHPHAARWLPAHLRQRLDHVGDGGARDGRSPA